jgi:hypothetical protein
VSNSNSIYFLIGVYAPTDASFRIEAQTFPHVSAEQLSKGNRLGFKKLYIGDSPDIELYSS